MILPPIGIAVVRVNPKVTDTDVRRAMRSVDCTTNETLETLPTMNPEETASDDAVSVDV